MFTTTNSPGSAVSRMALVLLAAVCLIFTQSCWFLYDNYYSFKSVTDKGKNAEVQWRDYRVEFRMTALDTLREDTAFNYETWALSEYTQLAKDEERDKVPCLWIDSLLIVVPYTESSLQVFRPSVLPRVGSFGDDCWISNGRLMGQGKEWEPIRLPEHVKSVTALIYVSLRGRESNAIVDSDILRFELYQTTKSGIPDY